MRASLHISLHTWLPAVNPGRLVKLAIEGMPRCAGIAPPKTYEADATAVALFEDRFAAEIAAGTSSTSSIGTGIRSPSTVQNEFAQHSNTPRHGFLRGDYRVAIDPLVFLQASGEPVIEPGIDRAARCFSREQIGE